MHPGLFIALAALVAIFLLIWFFGRGLGVARPSEYGSAEPHSPNVTMHVNRARLSDLQRLYELVASASHDDAWICFLPASVAPGDTEVVHLQFSLENDRPGLDWFLLAPANLRDRTSFEQLAESMGIGLTPGQRNGVDYLRTEEERGVELCRRVLVDMYGADESTILDLVFDKHDWTWEP